MSGPGGGGLIPSQMKCLMMCLCLSPPSLNLHAASPRDAEDEPLRPGHHYSQGAAGGEPQPLLERPRRSGGIVRFVLDKSYTE